MEVIVALGVLFFGLILYVLPAIVAFARGHHQKAAITVLTLLAGWTLIGWVGAMVWAFTEVRRSAAA